MPNLHLAAPLVMLSLAASGALAQTAQQAATLRTPELARLVLGNVGSTIIEIDRPVWPASCGGPICPPVSLAEEQRRGPAPVSNGITFYQRAVPTQGGTQWTGLCSSTALHVGFERDNRPDRVTLSKRYGLSPATQRLAPDAGPGQRGDFNREEKDCATITSVNGFFYANDDTAAFRAALAARLFARAVATSKTTGKPLPFAFTCSEHGRPCDPATDQTGVADRIAIPNLQQAAITPCPTPHSAGKHICYQLDYKELGANALAEFTEFKDNADHATLIRFTFQVDDVIF